MEPAPNKCSVAAARITAGAVGFFGLIDPQPDVDQNVRLGGADDAIMEWHPIATAPFDRNLELAVIDYDGTHALVFPCRRILRGWISADSEKAVTVYPTHWREWQQMRFEPSPKDA